MSADNLQCSAELLELRSSALFKAEIEGKQFTSIKAVGDLELAADQFVHLLGAISMNNDEILWAGVVLTSQSSISPEIFSIVFLLDQKIRAKVSTKG